MAESITRYLTVSTFLRIITAGLLVVALTKEPYDFFTVLRIVTSFTSAYLIYVAHTTKQNAVLFIPLKLFPVKRETWEIIDVIVAIVMLGSIFLVGEKLSSDNTVHEIKPPDDLA